MHRTIRIFIVDDHEIVLDGLKAILNPFRLAQLEPTESPAAESPFQIVGIATSGEDLLERIANINAVDVVVMDYMMKSLNGIETAKALKAIQPETKVVLFSMFDSDALIQDAFMANIEGYVTKGEGRQRLLETIRKVALGERVFPKLQHPATGSRPEAGNHPKSILSKREIEVACLITQGLTSQNIAAQLNIAFNTVEVHRANIYKKLDIKKLVDLVKYMLDQDLCK